ncbi:Hvo_1808 family surface protein [Halomicrococcus gelatinilyticus]|uniref:Hvo_1808 family surface protein n=1 Tax=Halomicrococcus gelatinilyticus TaxID=1702103 RepID=UPI002E11E5A0
MRTVTAIAVAAMLVLAGCSQAPGTSPTGPDALEQSPAGQDGSAATTPSDPTSDRLGWENGVWYNETVSVTRADGLNETELDAVVNRSMARVERIRKLEFEETVPVKVISRSEFKEQQQNRTTPAKRRLFDNVKYEALMMIGEPDDSIDVQTQNAGASVGGYYSPKKEAIVIVSNNETAPKMNEVTLAQELFHALQDQKFNLSSFDQSTREKHNAVDGLIEGDGNYVDYLYEQRCKDEWEGTCLMPNADGAGSGGGGGLANMGPYLLKFQPYSDGPPFVKGIREQGGWEAVNDLYENPPASTEQVIHPEKFRKDEPTSFTIDDNTSDGWTRLKPPGRPNYGEVGEAGMLSMFMFPGYESSREVQIVPLDRFLNTKDGNIQTLDPLNYVSEPSAGWDGDRIAVYTNPGTPRGETGYVFETRWDSPQDATEFADAYRRLLQYRNAEQVDGRANTWRIPESSDFDDAFHVERRGDTVVVVNAPTVEDLSDVHAGAAPKQ